MPLDKFRCYKNLGDKNVLGLVEDSDRLVLDVGCGAGDLGLLIRNKFPLAKVVGITCSFSEQKEASSKLSQCMVLDLEKDSLDQIQDSYFDLLILSHILEHLTDPVEVLIRLLNKLKIGGRIIIAVPNVLFWRQRLLFIRGSFEYTEGGPMHITHLHFYSYNSITRLIMDPIKELKLVNKFGAGHIPMGIFRKLFPANAVGYLDNLALSIFPNLFSYEIILVAKKIARENE